MFCNNQQIRICLICLLKLLIQFWRLRTMKLMQNTKLFRSSNNKKKLLLTIKPFRNIWRLSKAMQPPLEGIPVKINVMLWYSVHFKTFSKFQSSIKFKVFFNRQMMLQHSKLNYIIYQNQTQAISVIDILKLYFKLLRKFHHGNDFKSLTLNL